MQNNLKTLLNDQITYRLVDSQFYLVEIIIGINSSRGNIFFAESINDKLLTDSTADVITFNILEINSNNILNVSYRDTLIFNEQINNPILNIEIHKTSSGAVVVMFFDGEEMLFTRILVEMANIFRLQKNEGDIEVFQVGRSKNLDIHQLDFNNTIIRFGNVFDNFSVENSELIVLPISEKGTVSKATALILNEFNIRLPKINKLGEIEISTNYDSPKIIFACSVVDGNVTTTKIIRILLAKIYDFAINNSITKISLPMLGTGAGKLSIDAFLRTYFNFIINFDVRNIILNIIGPDNWKDLMNYLERECIKFYLRQRYKPSEVIALEKQIKNLISPDDYTQSFNGELQSIKIKGKDHKILDKFQSLTLKRLTIESFQVPNFDFLENLPNLKILEIIGCNIYPINLTYVDSLVELEITRCYLGENDMKFLNNCKHLKKITLKYNKLIGRLVFPKLNQLIHLDISHNYIKDIDISTLNKLTILNVSHNEIVTLDFLRSKKLFSLDISSNSIKSFEPLLNCRLEFLKAHNNPFVNEIDFYLDPSEDHLNTIKNIYKRLGSRKKIEVILPAKVMLLGNHGSGKSSFLHYIQNGEYAPKLDSTHIINVVNRPASGEKSWAIFYDFGGQDYYHGLYNAFLTGGAIYILLWQTTTNINQQRLDSHSIPTHDFSLNYWLAQKRYLEQEKYLGESDPLFLVQTHCVGKKTILPCKILNNDNFVGDFCVNLQPSQIEENERLNLASIRYLEEVLSFYINKTAVVREEPIWYADFISYVFDQVENSSYKPISIKEIAEKYRKGKDSIEFLIDDLDQLHKQGLILYYKDDFPDKVWFNVKALIKHIHTDILNNQKTDDRGYISQSLITKFDKDVVKLLERKSILIFDNNEKKYIIPNFLPLSSESSESFDLLTFDLNKPAFTLKFRDFLPFGLMNQIIGHFSNYWTAKSIWREKIVFKFEEHKVLIHIDFIKLEIQVCINSIKTNREIEDEVISYLFYSILASYWGFEKMSITAFKTYRPMIFKDVIDYDTIDGDDYLISQLISLYRNEACHPVDLFISLNGIDYVNHREICNSESKNISSYCFDVNSEIQQLNKLDQIHKYSAFTLKDNKAPKKVVISYSKSDIKYVQEFQKHISALHDIGLIDSPWYCTLLIAGTKWDETIQEKFNEADIIFFLVSHNLMSTSYVKEYEIKKAIDRYNVLKNIRIVPIILSACYWQRPGDYNLGDFTALPYAAEPISNNPNSNEIWTYIVKCIEIMILHSDKSEDWVLEKFNAMETTVERIIYNRDNEDGGV